MLHPLRMGQMSVTIISGEIFFRFESLAHLCSFLYPTFNLRRIFAAALVFLFVSGPLLPALAAVDSQSNLPECCRKNGAHMCSVQTAARLRAEHGGTPLARAFCPYSSHPLPWFQGPRTFVPPGTEAHAVQIPQRSASRRNDRTLACTRFALAHLQRGPPERSLRSFPA
jgi:hypothetical protein